ncbi:MAG: ABC transporter substrate-binding protein [Betaproteobacteria bacterium]|nr:ABC transporter substrate-binding protein [Betaproteobacteria bacterium]
MKKKIASALLALASAVIQPALAEINIGVTLSATGPAASLGIPEKNTVALLPATMGGQKVNYIVLDDATNPTEANKNAKRLVAEHKVDAIIGSTTTPTSLAAIEVGAETGTPVITMAPIPPQTGEKHAWSFVTPQGINIMASALVDVMKAAGVKSLGFIGFADAYGEVWLQAMKAPLASAGISMNTVERFQRTDTSVTGQTLKLMAANPDAVLVVGSGTPAVLPQASLRERGFKGRIYQTHGVANRDFLRVGGKNVDGAVFPVGPMLLAEELPDSHPSKRAAMDYVIGAHAWDAALLLANAVPQALKKSKPGTAEFRRALRDAIEATKELPAAHGVFNMSPSDHNGLDQRSRVMVRVEGGNWKLMTP